MDNLVLFRLRKLASDPALLESLVKEAKSGSNSNRGQRLRKRERNARKLAESAKRKHESLGAEVSGVASDAMEAMGRRDLKQLEHAGIVRQKQQTGMNQLFAPGRKNDVRNVSPALETYWKGSGMSDIDRANFESSAAYKRSKRKAQAALDKLKGRAAKRGVSPEMNQRVADVVRNTPNTGSLGPSQLLDRLRLNDQLPGSRVHNANKLADSLLKHRAKANKLRKLKYLKRGGAVGAGLAAAGGLGYGAYKLLGGNPASAPVPASAPETALSRINPELLRTLGYTGGGALVGGLAGGLASGENKLRNALVGAAIGGLGGYAADYARKRGLF